LLLLCLLCSHSTNYELLCCLDAMHGLLTLLMFLPSSLCNRCLGVS
jgi:hypothetical protein